MDASGAKVDMLNLVLIMLDGRAGARVKINMSPKMAYSALIVSNRLNQL
jgi:hypothetical protein